MPDSEARRLAALQAFGVMDTAPEEAFERLTALAAELFDAPIALISLMDVDRQWFKSRHGLKGESTPRDVAFCAHVLALGPQGVMVVEDALQDPRFSSNPLVLGEPNIRFYTGAALTTRTGENLGAFWVADPKPRARPSEVQIAQLQVLARIVVDTMELTKAGRVAHQRGQLLELAESMAGFGHWRYEVANQQVTWSDEVYRIHGVERATFNPLLDDAIQFYHPDDRAKVVGLLEIAIAEKGHYSFQARLIRRRDGDCRHVTNQAVCEIDESGAVIAVVGAFQDITDHVRTLKAVQRSERRYRLLSDNMSDVVTRLRLDGSSGYISPGIERLLGYRQDEMSAHPAQSFVYEADQSMILDTFGRMAGGEERLSVQHRAAHKDGYAVWVETGFQLIRDEAGRPAEVVAVIRDITERKAMEDDLRAARVEAEAAAAVKAQFLANMSHELRTPLTAVLGFAKLVEEQPELTAATRSYLDRVSNAGKALLATVNDILDFSKLEAGQFDIKLQSASPAKLALETLALFTVQADAKGIALRPTGVEGLPPLVRCDPDRVRQILLNLIGNAVKFTDAGTVTLDVAFDADQGRLSFSITDSGPGISKDHAARLFQRFSQIDGSSTRKHGGTGLGLAICKGLAEAMGGEIGVRSREGDGACFWFSIPTALGGRAEEAGVEDIKEGLQPGCRVLLVDDNLVNRTLVRAMLSRFDVALTEAVDGLEAVQIAGEQPFDVILMDLRMPGLDGPGAAYRIRTEDGPNCGAPIIAFSADTSERQDPALFDGAIAKPLTADSLVNGILKATGWDEDKDVATVTTTQERARHVAS
jgi:PAS domain S-box-containing protein